MNLSRKDFIEILKEIMEKIGYKKETIDQYFHSLDSYQLDLRTIVANVATQCFISEYNGPNSDVIRTYLKEEILNGKVDFNI